MAPPRACVKQSAASFWNIGYHIAKLSHRNTGYYLSPCPSLIFYLYLRIVVTRAIIHDSILKHHGFLITGVICSRWTWHVFLSPFPPIYHQERQANNSIITVSTASALASYTPITSGPKYQVGVPSGSSISSSSPGTIYFSLTAPTSYQWVGLGIGQQMAGAHVFVMYADGNNNVTISARDANQGHVEPVFNSSLASGVELLEGSGISNGVMTANVRCALRCSMLG